MQNPLEFITFWARLKPNDLAYADDQTEVTYKELNIYIRKICSYLTKIGVSHGKLVATNLPPYFGYTFGLAVQSLGATLITGASPDNLAGKINYDFFISTKKFDDVPIEKSILITEQLIKKILTSEVIVKTPGFRSENEIAILISTSGTTGEAKFIALGVEQLRNASTRPGTNDSFGGFEVLNLLPFGSGWSTFHALKCLSLGRPYFGFSYRDKRLLKILTNYPIRTIIGSPVQIESLIEILENSNVRLPNVESILVGGSSPTDKLFMKIRSNLNCRIYNTYGSTEAGQIAIGEIDEGGFKGFWVRPPVSLEIVDSHDMELPNNKVGEIRYKVPQMPNNYVNDEDATKSAFRNGYFYPGDLGKINEFGKLILEGRINEVLNIGGVKINAENIDRLVEQLPGVISAATYSFLGNEATEKLGIVVVSKPGLEDWEIRSHIQEKVGVMLSECKFVREIPRNPAGKVNRSTLSSL